MARIIIADDDELVGEMARDALIASADRQVHLVEHFSGPKVLLQKLGSTIVNKAASTATNAGVCNWKPQPSA